MSTNIFFKIIAVITTSALSMLPIAHAGVNGEADLIALLKLPRTASEAEDLKKYSTITRDYMSQQDAALVEKIKARAVELIPKNKPALLNFYGVEYAIRKNIIVRLSEGGKEEIILANDLIPANAGIVDFKISPDQTMLTFGYTFFGSDWQIWQVYSIADKKVLMTDGQFVFKNMGGQVMSWTPDSQKIIYPKFLSIEEDFKGIRKSRLAIHEVGSSQSRDQIIFENFEELDTTNFVGVAITNDEILVYRTQGVAVVPSALFLVNVRTLKRNALVPINKYFSVTPGPVLVGVRENVVYLRSTQAGNNFGIIALDTKTATTKILVPQQFTRTLYQSVLIGNKLIAQYIDKNLEISFELYDLQGRKVASMKPSDFGLIDASHPSLPLLTADKTSTTAYFTLSSVESHPVTFKIDVKNNKFIMLESEPVPFDSMKIERKLVEYRSYDGHKIKMFIFTRADLKNKPHEFAYLYSYGFIGIPNLSQWNRKFQLALELGAVVAIPAIRGGGEFGIKHQLAGTQNRWKTLKDLVFASRWLKKNLLIKDKRVAVVGRSFGGMTSLAHYVHHQDEFDLFSSIVPVGDVVRGLNENSWWMGDDFGINRDKASGLSTPEDFDALASKLDSWNPESNVNKLDGKKGLKPLIIFAQEFDTNTGSNQALGIYKKLVAGHEDQPIYLVEYERGGHGARAELIDELVFVAKEFGITEIKPLK